MSHYAYYNEFDPNAAQWLRNLMAAGHIMDGVVDERSIEDVCPADLSGFTQCHFFAGIGAWSYALRCAGWHDSRSVWTGSAPCQPFSAAGKGAGFDDERHLWPAFHHLISQCRPGTIFGEQVASKDADPWIDLVHTDLEALGYAFGAIAFPSAGVGAPHIRDRTYWVGALGNSESYGHNDRNVGNKASQKCAPSRSGKDEGCWGHDFANDGRTGGLAHPHQHHRGSQAEPAHHQQPQGDRPADWAGGVADSHGNGLAAGDGIRLHGKEHDAEYGGNAGAQRPGPVNGFWRAADWLGCRDDKWRPVEPGTFPLAHGAAARVGRLRGYGNAINAKAAQAFIEAVMS